MRIERGPKELHFLSFMSKYEFWCTALQLSLTLTRLESATKPSLFAKQHYVLSDITPFWWVMVLFLASNAKHNTSLLFPTEGSITIYALLMLLFLKFLSKIWILLFNTRVKISRLKFTNNWVDAPCNRICCLFNFGQFYGWNFFSALLPVCLSWASRLLVHPPVCF